MTFKGNKSRSVFIIAGLLCLIAFSFSAYRFMIFVEDIHGFGNLRKYGADNDGINWVSKVTVKEQQLWRILTVYVFPGLIFLATGLVCFLYAAQLEKTDKIGKRLLAVAGKASPWIVFPVILIIAVFVLKETGLTDDEDVYLFQARILADGHLTAPAHPLKEFFDNVFLINEDRMYGQYPVGHPLMLVPGVWVGFPYLMPAVMGLLVVLFSRKFAAEYYGKTTGNITAVLYLCSPFFLFTFAALGSGVSAIFFITILFLLFLSLEQNPDKRRMVKLFAAGFIGVWMYNIRPTVSVTHSLPILAAGFLNEIRKPQKKKLLMLFAGGAVSLVLIASLNWIMNGHPLYSGYYKFWMEEVELTEAIGFGKYPWGIEHTPQLGFNNAVINFLRLNFWLFGGPFTLVALISYILFSKKRKFNIFLIAPVIFSFALYFFYFWAGTNDTGPILYVETLPCLIILSARGIRSLADIISKKARLSAYATAIALTLAVFTGSLFYDYAQADALKNLVRKINTVYRKVSEEGVKKGLIFVKYYIGTGFQESWVATLKNNAPDFSDDVIYARDLGHEKNLELMEYYDDRPAYRIRSYRGNLELKPYSEGGLSWEVMEDTKPKMVELGGVRKNKKKEELNGIKDVIQEAPSAAERSIGEFQPGARKVETGDGSDR